MSRRMILAGWGEKKKFIGGKDRRRGTTRKTKT
jgi:hypothetical protein